MSDNINPEAVKAAIMADLSRLRQEELPLSHEAKRGPTFAPTRNNGTGHYSNAQKAELENKWSTKIVDEESQGMDGLVQGDVRPWAKNQVRQMFSANQVNKTPPTVSAPRGKTSSHRPPRAQVEFKAPTPARWGGPPTQTAAPANCQETSSGVTLNGTSSGNTVTTAAPRNDTSPAIRQKISPVAAPTSRNSRTHLVFKVDGINQNANASEYLLGSGKCDIVPGKNEALSFICDIAVKMRIAENKVILELRSHSKGLRSHNVLDIEEPVVDDVFCTIKVKSRPWPDYLRFGTDDDASELKRCLSSIQDVLQAHQSEPDIDQSQAANKNEEPINTEAEDNELVMVESPVISTAPGTPSPGSINTSQDISQATIDDEEPLITIDDYGSVTNTNLPDLGPAIQHLNRVMDQVLEEFGAQQSLSSAALDGIMDAVFEQWTSHGFLGDCSDELRQCTLELLRYVASWGGMLHYKATQSTTDSNVNSAAPRQDSSAQQTQESTNRSARGMPKGLGASRFAKKPAAYEGKFTGPQF
ncbi:hypothetical protein FBEOM_4707 [Fusarium beomiforme]|uniref:Uncharacterized protein n=1 Tax=Fusarium beomiforme TaxID=44412 RepID=A0A9P5AMD8_9HYPO|nr:hypothetical protein FBEOM_4707 [Fusarium beomiforme]